MKQLHEDMYNASIPKNPVPRTSRLVGAYVQCPLGQTWRILSANETHVRLVRETYGTEVDVLLSYFIENYVLLLDRM